MIFVLRVLRTLLPPLLLILLIIKVVETLVSGFLAIPVSFWMVLLLTGLGLHWRRRAATAVVAPRPLAAAGLNRKTRHPML